MAGRRHFPLDRRDDPVGLRGVAGRGQPAGRFGQAADQPDGQAATRLTLDVFFANDTDYERIAAVLTAEAVADVYHVGPARVRLYRLSAVRVIKISFPRPVVQGSLGDRDMHSGQQYIPLAALPVSTKQES